MASILHAVFEGLPHPLFERELFEREQRKNAFQEIENYPFYNEPLTVSQLDGVRVCGVLEKPGTYLPFSGEKRCGGFHSDFAIKWQRENSVEHALLCFGCREVKVAGDQGCLRSDLEHDAYEFLRSTLKPYRKIRR